MAAPDQDLLKEMFARVDAFASETKYPNEPKSLCHGLLENEINRPCR